MKKIPIEVRLVNKRISSVKPPHISEKESIFKILRLVKAYISVGKIVFVNVCSVPKRKEISDPE